MKCFVLILAGGIFTGIGLQAQPQLADAIEVVVHDSVITQFQIRTEVEPYLQQIGEQYRGQPAAAEKKVRDLEVETRDRLMEDQLVLHEFETAGYSLPESIIDEFVQRRIRSMFTDRGTLTKTLQERGITYEKFRKGLRDDFIIAQMHMKNVSDVIVISPYKIEKYYVAHTNIFKVEERVKLRMIVLNKTSDDSGQAAKMTQEILTKIREGASFAEMATGYSQGLHSREGGDWGWVDKFNSDGAPVLRKELFDVAFSLNPGETSGLIETPEACYLMRVDDKRPAQVKPLSEVRVEIENTLQREERNRLQKQWVERLKKKTFVRLFLQD